MTEGQAYQIDLDPVHSVIGSGSILNSARLTGTSGNVCSVISGLRFLFALNKVAGI
jgi:hypothetical protein